MGLKIQSAVDKIDPSKIKDFTKGNFNKSKNALNKFGKNASSKVRELTT